MIFVAGVHGVGKTFFSNRIKAELEIATYDASEIIAKEKNSEFSKDKKIKEPNLNQESLIRGVEKIKQREEQFLLNGHFCLLDSLGEIVPLEQSVFEQIAPEKIILLEEAPDIIIERRFVRDKEKLDSQFIQKFMEAEHVCAYRFAKEKGIPILTVVPSYDFERAIKFIAE